MTEKNEKTISQAFLVDKYFFQSINPNIKHTARMKKYIRRKKISGHFYYSREFENFYDWIVGKLTQKNNETRHLGYINDTVFLTHNPVKVPPAPKEWDVLCFNGNISKYIFNNENNNIYWNRAYIHDSDTFVINIDNLPNIVSKFKIAIENKGEKSFFDIISQSLNVFIITQYYFTDNIYNTIEKQTTINNATKDQTINDYNKQSNLLFDKLYDKYYDKDFLMKEGTIDNKLFPKISFITPLDDTNTFFHNMILFNEVNYPNAEMVIVDYQNLELKVKRLLKEEPTRFKLVKINNTAKKTDDGKIPLGFILNSGIQCATGSVIIPFFNDNHYNIKSIGNLIYNFVYSQFDCFIGSGIKSYNIIENSLVESTDKISLSNLIFTLNFWRMNSFDELCNDSTTLLYYFIKNRMDLISFYKSTEWNFPLIKGKKKSDIQTPNIFDKNSTRSLNLINDDYCRKWLT